MNRKEAEDKIMDLLIQINEIKKQFSEDDYLTLCCGSEQLSFNNSYWEPINGVLKRVLFLNEEGGDEE